MELPRRVPEEFVEDIKAEMLRAMQCNINIEKAVLKCRFPKSGGGHHNPFGGGHLNPFRGGYYNPFTEEPFFSDLHRTCTRHMAIKASEALESGSLPVAAVTHILSRMNARSQSQEHKEALRGSVLFALLKSQDQLSSSVWNAILFPEKEKADSGNQGDTS